MRGGITSVVRSMEVDAKAEGNELGMGGRSPVRDEGRHISKEASPCFATRLKQRGGRSCPAGWAFLPDGQSLRLIATLEALGVSQPCKPLRRWELQVATVECCSYQHSRTTSPTAMSLEN